MIESARTVDRNGWLEIKGNPISKVGVFSYRGSMIDPSGEMGLDPEGVYEVFRSEAELSNQETIDSFKLIPWIDEHLMLGENFDPVEDKGIEGVIGEDVYFEDGYLKGNLKLFSDKQRQKVADGKVELSCGYRCEYALQDGVFGDKSYGVVQTKIRGNHLASIDEGRMGPEVSVLDQKLTFAIDTKDFSTMAFSSVKTLKSFATDGVKPEEVGAVLQLLASKVCALDEKDDDKAEDEDDDKAEDTGESPDLGQDDDDDKAEDEDEDDDKAEDKYDDKAEDKDDDEKAEDGYDDDKKSGAMDALDAKVRGLTKELRVQKRTGFKSIMREIRDRDALYTKVSPVIGAFDHADMSRDELARYACNELSLKAPRGHEVTALDAYFVNRPAPRLFATDSALVALAPKAGGAVAKFFAPESA